MVVCPVCLLALRYTGNLSCVYFALWQLGKAPGPQRPLNGVVVEKMDDGLGIVFLHYWETEKNNFSMCSLLLFMSWQCLSFSFYSVWLFSQWKKKKKTQTNEDSCCSFMLVWQTQFLSQVTKYPAAQAWIMNDVDLISLTFSMKEFNLKTILKIWLRFSISMCLLQLSQWACIFLPLWPASSLLKKKNQTLSSGFWDSLYCKPREDHTLAEDYCGRWIQVDLACGNLPSIDDSQFSCSVPLLAQVTLTQLVTKSAVGTTILMLLKCCNC